VAMHPCCGRWIIMASPCRSGASLLKYGERLFSRPAFIEALTPSEKAMRK